LLDKNRDHFAKIPLLRFVNRNELCLRFVLVEAELGLKV